MNDQVTRVLLVEDNPGDARLIREILTEAGSDGFEIEWVSQLSEGLERLAAGKVDLVFLDLGLPDSRGFDTFLKAYAHLPEVPFVLLTGLDDKTLALTAVRQGAQDYLVKGETDANALLRAIRYATERKLAERALETERKNLFAVLNSLPVFIHLKGADFKIRFANRRFQEVFGNPGNKPCYEILQGRSDPCEDCHSLEVLKTKVPQQFEWTNPNNARTYEVYHYPFCTRENLQVLTLYVDITKRKQAERQLFEKAHALGERVKELHCLSSIASLMGEVNISLDEIIQRVLELIPPAWQYPDITCARITFEELTFKTVTFRETQWRQASDILVNGDCLGSVEVFYLREKPTLDEGPFLKEERSLLESIAKTLGVIITRKQAEKEISRLASFPQLNPNPILEIDTSGAITYYNQATVAALEKLEAVEPGDFLPGDLGKIQVAARETGERVFYREVKIKDAIFREHIHFAEGFNVLRIYASNTTARKQAEQNLQESEQNLRHLASQLLTAQERERERISRDLHDDLGQSLMVLKMRLQAIERELPLDLSGLRNELSAGINCIDAITENVRRLAKDLQHPILRDFGLSVALKHLFNNFIRHNDIKMSFKMEDIDDLFSPEGQHMIYRIFQEALTNIAKHGQAARVSINIKRQKQNTVFTIKDNGKGFDVNRILAGNSSTRGLGLSAMKERVNMLGGSLEIWSQEGQGTTISLTVPLNH